MEIVVGKAHWPKPRQKAPQAGPEGTSHLCRLCFGPIERHAGDGVGETFWCRGCGSAAVKLNAVCFCGVSRAGARLKCVTLGNEGGPAEVVVMEKAEATVAEPIITGWGGRQHRVDGGDNLG